ncbi:hypothetical protein BV25DRAFT_1802759 [Artomyces pyxidatus]|uniref:Uncharacterized protein n=1 Tax=Artomyces pyxidatus TaxID=48021 RepID=A0ACB8T3S4_9AGAM|nr:hypothetical protein BV25DRAFT_1802759 [Artomyces pyxidatus]
MHLEAELLAKQAEVDKIQALEAIKQKEQRRIRAQLRALEAKVYRIPQRIRKAVESGRQRSSELARAVVVKKQRAYIPEMRSLARILVKSGCSQAHVGAVIQRVARMAGKDLVSRAMSRRTVGRAIKEGGIASNIQLGHEIATNKDFTASCDGTSHKDLQYEALHIALLAPSYEDPSAPHTHKLRLVSVRTTVNHTSESQLEGIKESLEAVRKAYADSPLAKRTQISLEADEVMLRWRGLNTDHAADQQKLYRLACLWKAECLHAQLGQVKIISQPSDALIETMLETNQQKILDAGGQQAWDALTAEQKTVREVTAMRQLSIRLGKEAYGDLPEEKRRELDLFIWCGCCMHKELNSVKGGNRAMQEYWIKQNLPGPILLANRDNAATLDGIADGEAASTAAEKRAQEVSSRGGVKTADLAGALFNHKDDKKGAQDTYRNYLRENYGRLTKFPDTSNTRYQSYCEAAAELLVYKDGLVSLLDLIKDKKTARTLNHMEQNVYNALHDIPTLTELSVLVLYSQAITHPYMRVIRGSDIGDANMLNYGPYHREVLTFIQKLIDEPALLLGDTATYKTGSLDGKEWFRSEAVAVVRELAPSLPHLEGALVAFLQGSLATWERFTSEFAPGGLIDLATATERERAWMPATNDANEGALGSFRLHARMKPNSTIQAYNAQATYTHNDTESFMGAVLNKPEDHLHLMRMARAADSSGLAAKARAEQVAYDQRVVEEKRAKDKERTQKEAEKTARFLALAFVVDLDAINKLSSTQLEDQLDKHRRNGDKEIGLKKLSTRKADKLVKLLDAVTRYQTRLAAEDVAESTVEGASEALDSHLDAMEVDD